VVAWGSSKWGGDCSAVAEELIGVKDIFQFENAFAALTESGTLVTWGGCGGDSSAVKSQLRDVKEVYGNGQAIVAITGSSGAVAWGDSDCGGDCSEVHEQLHSLKLIVGNSRGFAALRSDGCVFYWGEELSKETPNLVVGDEVKVIRSFNTDDETSSIRVEQGTHGHVTAIDEDGDAQIRFSLPNTGERWVFQNKFDFLKKTQVIQTPLHENVVKIAAAPNPCAFAALKMDGSVAAWGKAGYGGQLDAVRDQLSEGVVEIVASNSAFAAVKSDSSVVFWGSPSESDSCGED